MDIRRLHVFKEVVYAEGGLPAFEPVTRVASCAVILNPLSGRAQDDLSVLVPFGEQLGKCLIHEALSMMSRRVVAYGKAAIVGVSGDIEHAAAILHPQMGKPIREAIGGGKALIPSNVKIGAAGAAIDVPLGHKDDAWSFDQIDTMSVLVPGAPRPDEIVVVVVVSNGGRPRPRVSKAGAAVPTRAR